MDDETGYDTYTNPNRLIAYMISSLTATLRVDGALLNVGLTAFKSAVQAF